MEIVDYSEPGKFPLTITVQGLIPFVIKADKESVESFIEHQGQFQTLKELKKATFIEYEAFITDLTTELIGNTTFKLKMSAKLFELFLPEIKQHLENDRLVLHKFKYGTCRSVNIFCRKAEPYEDSNFENGDGRFIVLVDATHLESIENYIDFYVEALKHTVLYNISNN